MANNRIVRYVTNTALLAVLAAAGIGVYQLGTSGTDVEIQEEAPSYLDDTADTKENEDSAVDAGTSLVEAEMKDEGTDTEKEMTGVENTVLADTEDADQTSVQTVDGNGAAQSVVSTESVSTSASAEAAPKLSFSEDTLMEWPVDGSDGLFSDAGSVQIKPGNFCSGSGRSSCSGICSGNCLFN